MATKNLISSVNTNGSFSEGSKKTLRKMAEATGEISVLDADFAKVNNTLADVTGLPSYELKAGRKYFLKVRGVTTGTTGTGGVQFKFNLSGTQTSAVYSGSALVWNAITGAALVQTTSSLNASTVVATVAAAAMVGTEFGLEAELFLQPQNDGKLTVQFAQTTTAAGNACTMKRGTIFTKIDLE